MSGARRISYRVTISSIDVIHVIGRTGERINRFVPETTVPGRRRERQLGRLRATSTREPPVRTAGQGCRDKLWLDGDRQQQSIPLDESIRRRCKRVPRAAASDGRLHARRHAQSTVELRPVHVRIDRLVIRGRRAVFLEVVGHSYR